MAEKTLLPGIAAYPSYLRTLVDRLGDRYSYVDEIAKGKTGIAYKLRSNENEHLCFCLKTIRPDITDTKQRNDVRENLEKEAKILSPLAHRCLPTIFDSNFTLDPPFYICTYHPGMTFANFRKDGKTCRFQDAINIVWALIDTLKYLHQNGRTHCDLHANNILIGGDVIRDGLLVIDFGSGHRLSDSSPETENRGNVNFKTFEGARLDRSKVGRSSSQLLFQASDFVALGKLLAEMADCFVGNAPAPTRRAYSELAISLMQNNIDSWERAEEALLSVIDPFRPVSANMDIFLSSEGIPQVIIVPGLSTVQVGRPSLAIINTRAFQRLRGIRQLSFCDWLFPGATHTRFEHSLGVFSVAKRAMDSLIHDSEFRNRYTALDVRGFLLASLIHDIGHYPFAHVVEQYVAGRFPGDLEAKQIVSHESNARHIIDTDEDLKGVLANEWGQDAVLQAIKTFDGQKGTLSRLLDGPIDVDKIDYLTRDAAHCGVRYGGGLDSDLLLRSLCCTSDAEDIGALDGGVPAIEGLMILQDQMLSQVYWNEGVRGLIAMFHAILAHLVRHDRQKLNTLVEGLKNCSNDGEAFKTVLVPMVGSYSGPEKDQLKQLVDAFVNPHFNNGYQSLKTYRAVDLPHARMHINVYNTIVKHSTNSNSEIPIDWKAVGKLRAAFLKAFSEKEITVSRLDVVIDIPFGKAPRRVVKVKSRDSNKEIEIHTISHLKETAFTQPAMHLSPVRVYLAPQVFLTAQGRLSSIVEAAEEEFAANKLSSSVDDVS